MERIQQEIRLLQRSSEDSANVSDKLNKEVSRKIQVWSRVADPDPYWIQIRIGIQPEMLDPDPDEMNADPQPWDEVWTVLSYQLM